MITFPVQKILFDLDGTLVDTAADLHAATNHTLSSVGREPISLDQVRNLTGYGAIRLIELGLDATGGRAGLDMTSLRHEFLQYYSQNICDHSSVFEGGFDMLNTLKEAGFQMAICTNKPEAMAVKLLDEIGISPYFNAVTGGDSFDFKKPDGRHLHKTSAMLEGAGNSIMIGDSSPDVNGARSAGFPVIAVDFGYPDRPINEMEPDAIISSLGDLPSLLTLTPSS